MPFVVKNRNSNNTLPQECQAYKAERMASKRIITASKHNNSSVLRPQSSETLSRDLANRFVLLLADTWLSRGRANIFRAVVRYLDDAVWQSSFLA
jgi:hypothetical protein